MDVHPIAKMIAEKGIDSVSLDMFPEEQAREIYSQAADILLRLNKTDQAFIAMERAGRPLPLDQLKRMADNLIALGKYRQAYDLLVKTNQIEMAEFVKHNFL
jgi:tetratricopeptide (TPR) repeat protein